MHVHLPKGAEIQENIKYIYFSVSILAQKT